MVGKEPGCILDWDISVRWDPRRVHAPLRRREQPDAHRPETTSRFHPLPVRNAHGRPENAASDEEALQGRHGCGRLLLDLERRQTDEAAGEEPSQPRFSDSLRILRAICVPRIARENK